MDVAAWRREKRTELYSARKAMTAEQRHDAAQKIAVRLDNHCKRDRPGANRTLLAN
jgi:5-formyltetrahydrofolate cyclo-ligase